MAEAKTDFQLAFDNLRQHFKSLKGEMETKDNQLCDFKHHIGLLKDREVHYLHEIDVLQFHDKPEANKLRGRVKQLQEELSQLNEHFHSDILKHNYELDKLQDELKRICSEDAISTQETLLTTTDEISEENLMLEKELQQISKQICEKQLCLNQLEEQNAKLVECINNVHLELEELKENAECKKQELVESYDLMNNLQETILIIKTELKALKGKSIESNNDENSLFAEVNDRRLELQETLLSLSEKCNKMKLEVSKKQKHISTLRLHNEELTSLLKNDPIECQQDYKTLIDMYTSRIYILENLSDNYKNLLSEKEELFVKGLPNNIMEFLNKINEKHRKIEEQLNETVGMEFRAQKMMLIQLKEINLKIQEWKNTVDQLESKLLDCEIRIQKMKLQEVSPSIETKENDVCDKSKNSENLFGNGDNEKDKCEKKQKLAEECHKENSSQNANISEIKLDEKRVTFTADTKSSSNHVVRKGGKVLQCKSVHISSLIKKN